MDGAHAAAPQMPPLAFVQSGSRNSAHSFAARTPGCPCLLLPCSKAKLNFEWADYEGQFSTQELDAFDAAYEKRKAAPRGELL